MKQRLSTDDYVSGIQAGNRVVLGKAITLVESTLPDDQQQAYTLLHRLMPFTGNSIRIGITGVPGVGKSTFIETFGNHLTDVGKKVAVLTVDPSSQLTQGSILGDKTRMEALAKNPHAYIRPTASGNTLGGVAGKTRNTILLCEAAGFDVIIVETVGVGQSEVAVKNMVDFFLLLMLAGAGDELQGIKKGIMEMADTLVITKADGDNLKRAKAAQTDYQRALHLFQTSSSGWVPRVLTCSALNGTGIQEVWDTVQQFFSHTLASGTFQTVRDEQNVQWMHDYFMQLVMDNVRKTSALSSFAEKMQQQVRAKSISAPHAAVQLFDYFLKSKT